MTETPDQAPAPVIVQAPADSGGSLGPPGGPILPVLMVIAGGYLMWFGVKYWRGAGPAVWPSYPIKSVLQGKGIPPNTPAPTAGAQLGAYEAGSAAAEGGGGNIQGQLPSGHAQNTAKLLLSKFGWASGQFAALDRLWQQESGWSPTARNPSGALGIAQALGHGGNGTAGSLGNEYGAQYGLSVADARAANSGSVLQQIRWGLGYIKATYGSPEAAWAHEQTFNWY